MREDDPFDGGKSIKERHDQFMTSIRRKERMEFINKQRSKLKRIGTTDKHCERSFEGR